MWRISVGADAGSPVRVLVLGSGPAELEGLSTGMEAYPTLLAQSLATRMHRRVEVASLDTTWELSALRDALQLERVDMYDAVVVGAAYRPQLAQIALTRWKRYFTGLCTTLVECAGPQTVIRLLVLPWRQAARDAPSQWAGGFGNRVIVAAEMAEELLPTHQRALLLHLDGPVMKQEWVGPSFSMQTYARWANQAAAELAHAIPT